MRHDPTLNRMWYFRLQKAKVSKSMSCSLWSTCNICLKRGRVSSHDREDWIKSAQRDPLDSVGPWAKCVCTFAQTGVAKSNAFEIHTNSVKIRAKAFETVLLHLQWNVCVCACVRTMYILSTNIIIYTNISIDYSNLRQRSRLICNIEHAIRCPSLLTSGSKASDWLCTERSWSGPKNRALVTRLCQNW